MEHASAAPALSGAVRFNALRDAVAGALAGVAVSLVLHPVDTVKVLVQARVGLRPALRPSCPRSRLPGLRAPVPVPLRVPRPHPSRRPPA